THELRAAFEDAYFKRFKVDLQEIRVNLVNINTSVVGRRSELDLSTLIDPKGKKLSLSEAETGYRRVFFNSEWHRTPVYWRDHLPSNLQLKGPAIIEQMDSTTVLEPGDYAECDDDGNIIITIGISL
ncbi:MAG: hydantoinase/oxoprolinase family protein, partial [Pseudomonadota bacterium]|nr:hydantoinase/oxoprolinase family protein [Pseudomonadota bacterium]